jgi:manganese/zinc/iron transport system substrate-binding protein
MRLMKCWVFFLCALVVAIAAACSKSQNNASSQSAGKQDMASWMEENGKIKVLSSVRMIDDLVEKIGGDRVDRWTLIHGEIDPHSYEMVKGDDEKIGFAQVVFYNGLGLEHGASLAYRLQKHPNAIALAEAIRALQPEKILSRGGQVDPHIWMDISLWKETVDPIVVALSALSPQDAEYFRINGEELKKCMMVAHEEIQRMMQAIASDKRFLVTSHDSFHYFARTYLAEYSEQQAKTWLQRFIAPEGLAPEGQISPADIQDVIDYLLLHRVNTVFPESNVSRDALRKIVEACAKKNLNIEIAPSCLHSDAMGPKGSEMGSYLGMMRHNAQTMAKAWTDAPKDE